VYADGSSPPRPRSDVARSVAKLEAVFEQKTRELREAEAQAASGRNVSGQPLSSRRTSLQILVSCLIVCVRVLRVGRVAWGVYPCGKCLEPIQHVLTERRI